MIYVVNYIQKLFSITQEDILCNTSYPFTPHFFESYRSSRDIMESENHIGIYVHIPFCTNLCRFCEYTKFKSGDNKKESLYLSMLKNQIFTYIEMHPIELLYGLDIGGGTPTSLGHNNFELLMEIVSEITNKYSKVNDYESSIEFTLSTIDDSKIRFISQAGFKRVSTGIQIYIENFQNCINF